MNPARVDTLLSPFLSLPLSPSQAEAFAVYLELLLRWNARLSLTAVRDEESIVTRHYGESLFAACCLLRPTDSLRAIDVGSGPGFPGLPMKIFCPGLRLTLIESQHKKVTFLREVIRALRLEDVDVYAGRAQEFPEAEKADVVTLRAVERFEDILPVAASLLRKSHGTECKGNGNEGDVASRLALLIGASQVDAAHRLAPNFRWNPPVSIPQSSARIVLIGSPEP